MKRKLFRYMFLLALLLLLTLAAELLLFGRFENTGANTYEALDIQMENFEKDISTHFDRLAAASISLSETTTVLLEDYLSENNLSFPDLNDAGPDIAAIQETMLEPLCQTLLQENCSGVFVMLDATVNSTITDAPLSRTGLYLQKSGYRTQDKSIMLYRGLAEIGKRHDILLHWKWRLEFRTDLFPNYSDILALQTQPQKKAYLLTERFTLSGTAENAMLMVSPIMGSDGTWYGICGYEISAGFFKAYHAQPTKMETLICLLTKSGDHTVDMAQSLSCGASDGYYSEPKGLLSVKQSRHHLQYFIGEDTSYVGITRTVALSPNNTPHTLAVMMQKADYDRAVMKSTLQNTVLWALILFFAISCCIFFSRRFLSPILKALEQIKSNKHYDAQSSIPEINDLFAFLAEQDRQYEDSLSTLERENRAVQSENIRLQTAYEQAQLVYEQAQAEYIRARSELADAQKELDRLAYSRKTEIDPDDYRHFLSGIQELTKTEREVFDWYLEGKTAKDILELTGIKEGTLKFHNHNILQKLGVSSRKQMLRFAALMAQEKQEEN